MNEGMRRREPRPVANHRVSRCKEIQGPGLACDDLTRFNEDFTSDGLKPTAFRHECIYIGSTWSENEESMAALRHSAKEALFDLLCNKESAELSSLRCQGVVSENDKRHTR